MRPEVTQGEEDAEGLLHAQKPIEGPFPVELHNFGPIFDASASDDVLAGVVAFAGAVPEEEATVEGDRGVIFSRAAIFCFTDLEAIFESRKTIASGAMRRSGEGKDEDGQGEDP